MTCYNNKKTKIKTLKNINNSNSKTKKYYKKMYGGEGQTTSEKKEGAEGIEDIKEDREKTLSGFTTGVGELTTGLADSEIVKDSVALTEGIAAASLEGVGDLVGVDLEHPEQTTEKLNTLVENSAIIGAVALEAADPFIQPMVDKTIDVASKSVSKLGETGVKVLLNTATEIPGVGVIIGSARSLSNIVEAGLSLTDAASQIITTFSDTMNASSRNFSNLIKQKGNITKRTDDSIKTFSDSNVSSTPVPTGGGTRKKIRSIRRHNKSYKMKRYK